MTGPSTGAGPGSPWADPATPTVDGAPYAGPPLTAPPPTAPPPAAPGMWAPPGWPAPGYPQWGWTPPPPKPRVPGRVITAAVLAFVQAVLVLVGTLYLYFIVSLAGLATGAPGLPAAPSGLFAEGRALAVVQVASVVLLVVAGIRALTRRSPTVWRTLLAAVGVQALLVLYWGVRLADLAADAPRGGIEGVLVAVPLFFLPAPVAALGLLVTGAARGWFGVPATGRPGRAGPA